MKLKLDTLGRVVLPKPLRERYALHAGSELEVLERAGELVLRVPEQKPSMVKTGGWWVHQGTPLPGADLTTIVERVREERDRSNVRPRR